MDCSSCGIIGLSVLIILLLGWLFGFKKATKLKRICVVVLGDVGRSPRMQYHALSFIKEGFDVDLVGYGNSPLIEELASHQKLTLITVKEPARKPIFLPQLLYYVLKTLYLFVQLVLVILLKTSRHSFVLVQNPPAIPTLLAAWLVCVVHRSTLIIDWHNYGYTILSLTLTKEHPLVKVSKIYEGFFGRRATYNICVTQAMRKDLIDRWDVIATTLYDRPPEMFKSVDIASRHKLFSKLMETYEVFKPSNEQITSETRFTYLADATVSLKAGRPALLISSTSWTEDEDFSILLKAFEIYGHSSAKLGSNLPKVVCAITGKGPRKEYYQNAISKMDFKNVQICTPWLDASDYPKLVGSADLGICLHTSSSGLDLPMKVVDMFGCGVPVCAVGFSCLHELVEHGKNGMVFQTAEELADHLIELLQNFPSSQEKLNCFRENLKDFQNTRWHDCWKTTFYKRIMT